MVEVTVSVAFRVLGAGGLERDRKSVRAMIAGDERVIGRQASLESLLVKWTVPGVAGRDVAARILGRDGDAERAARGRGRRRR